MFKTSSKVIQGSVIISLIAYVLFVVFYVIAALKYPGGTYARPNQSGFSMVENYLCDLLDDITYALEDNPAKIYARISLGFLCLGIFLFWFHLPELFPKKNNSTAILRISGMLSMLVCVFLAPGNHDLITRLAGSLGALAMILSFIHLYKAGFGKFMVYGIICLGLILLNYYIYESGYQRPALPMIQKFTTVLCLGWFVMLNKEVLLRKRHKG